MAGNFPDVPSNRMVLDKDGTQFFFINANLVISQMSSAQVATMTNDSIDNVAPAGTISDASRREYMVAIFPEKRDLKGWYAAIATLNDAAIKTADPTRSRVEVSTNTTNGIDGTWTEIGSLVTPQPFEMVPAYRTDIKAVNALGIKAVRFVVFKNWGLNVGAIHLYGTISAGENPQRLAIWHPTQDQQIPGAWFDWGNVPRGSSADKQFRVKNMHGSLSAQNITLGLDALTDANPSTPAQHLISSDGSTFAGSATLGSLAPGAISGIYTLRRVTPTNAQLGLWTLRLTAEAQSWA